MPGKAYTPSGYDPEVHGEFQVPPPPVRNALIKAFLPQYRHHMTERLTYPQIYKKLRNGEGARVGHYGYEMMYDIYAGIEDQYLEGGVDNHLHIYPDYVPRAIDIVDLAIEASKAKMAAIVCKDHFFTNVGMAWAAERRCNELVQEGKLEKVCHVFGTHVLAWSHHPDQIHLVRKYPNLGAIYFSTMTGHGQCGPDLAIVDAKEKLMPEVKECITLCAEYKIPIMTGHRKPFEVLPMVEHAQKVGAHILVTHAGGHTFEEDGIGMAGTIEQAKELARMGAYLEINGDSCVPNMMWPYCDPNVTMEYVKKLGSEHIIAGTDFGQPTCPTPIEGYRLFIRLMIHYGLSDQEIRDVVQKNAAKFLYLEE
jgi:hypothetical protein